MASSPPSAHVELPGLSFSPGQSVQLQVWNALQRPISWPDLGRGFFVLVASFGRCKFRLCPASVSFILQATIGGVASHFRVSFLSDRTFKFSVSSSAVGFFILKLRSFSCDLYSIFFHPWGNGGPNWQRELRLFQEEDRASWTTVRNASAPRFTAQNAFPPPLSGANRVPIGKPKISNSLKNRLVFPLGSDTARAPTLSSAPAHDDSPRPSRICPRCLLAGHPRVYCKRPIRCHACMDWGHVASFWRASLLGNRTRRADFRGLQSSAFKGKSVVAPNAGLFTSLNPDTPSGSSPPTFSSFGEFFKTTSLAGVGNPPADIVVPWPSKSSVQAHDLARCEPGLDLLSVNPASWRLNSSASCQFVPPSSSTPAENPTPSPLLVSPSPPRATADVLVSADMAYQRADPAPFIPEGLQFHDVPNRVFMVRAVAPTRPPARNEDFAIATFDPLPPNAMHFPAVRSVLRDFFRFERPTTWLEMQPTHLGQALVRFRNVYDRDALVAGSPHPCGDVLLSFCNHNQGRNWRAAEFNHECWLLLLGMPEDYWTERHIQSAVGGFAKVLLYQADENFRCRLLVRARVTDVEKIPQFIAYSDPDTVGGESWTIQCEVLLENQAQAQVPPPEDPIPEDVDMEAGVPFDFFGLGQPVGGPDNQIEEDVEDQNDQNDWDPWPVDVQAQHHHQLGQPVLDLNAAPQFNAPQINQHQHEQLNLNINLNLAPPIQDVNQDLQPVILNPVLSDEDLIGLQFDMHEVHLLQPQGEVYIQNQHEIESVQAEQIIGEVVPQPILLDAPQFNFNLNMGPLDSPINSVDEEIPLDQLVDHVEAEPIEVPPDQQGNELNLPGNQQLHQQNPVEEQQLSEASMNMNLEPDPVDDQLLLGSPEPEEPIPIPDHLGQDNTTVEGNLATQALMLLDNPSFKGNNDSFVVKIPVNWFPFLTSLLHCTETFGWASEFMSSPAAELIGENQGNISFHLPKQCLVSQKCCEFMENNIPPANHTTAQDKGKGKGIIIQDLGSNEVPIKKRRASRRLTPIVDSQVRRSERVKQINNGFKAPGCVSKKCFCCNQSPPTLSPKVIRNLAVQFCGMNEEEVNEAALMNKKKKIDPITGKRNQAEEPTGRQAEQTINDEDDQ